MTDSTTIAQPNESIERADWQAWRRQRRDRPCRRRRAPLRDRVLCSFEAVR